MMSSEKRPIGILERWYIARSKAGATPLPHVGFSISIATPLSNDDITATVKSALSRLPELHPFLNSRFVGHDTAVPELEVTDESVNLEEVLRTGNGEDLEAIMSEIDSKMDLDGPMWAVCLFLPPVAERSPGSSADIYVGLSVHHAIADGLSVLSVARSLVLLLNDPEIQGVANTEGSLPVLLESELSVRPSTFMFLSALFQSLVQPRLPRFITTLYKSKTTCWKGAADPQAPPGPRRQMHKLMQVTPDTVRRLVAIGRENKTTLTVILHSLLMFAISPLVPADQHLESTTPMSLRPLLRGWSPARGGVYISGLVYTCPPTSFPTTLPDFFEYCRPYSTQLYSPSAPQEGLEKWGLVNLLGLRGMISYMRKEVSHGAAKKSLSISNLGNCIFSNQDVKGGWKPRSAVFTQPLHGPGSALFVDVISVALEEDLDAGAGSTIVFGWEDGVLSEEQADGVMQRTKEGWEWLLQMTSNEQAEN